MKKKYIQACEVGGSIYGKKRKTSNVAYSHQAKVTKNDIKDAYNRFFKNQVTALYDAINKTK